jgi:hypothetical protein
MKVALEPGFDWSSRVERSLMCGIGDTRGGRAVCSLSALSNSITRVLVRRAA